MSKLNEAINSLTDENAEEVKEQLLSEADALNKKNSDLYKRAKKAEGFKYDRNIKKWIKEEEKKEPKPKEAEKPNEPDYAKIAFLEQRNISHPDDQKLVAEEAERLKLPLTDILGMEHIKSKLKDISNQREAEGGMPKGGSRGSGKTSQDIDYWLAKGETPEDPKLAEKVIEAKMEKEATGNKFADISKSDFE